MSETNVHHIHGVLFVKIDGDQTQSFFKKKIQVIFDHPTYN